MNEENSRQTTLREFGLVFLVAVMLSGCTGEIIPDPPSDDDRVIPNSSTLEGSFTVLVGDNNSTTPVIVLGDEIAASLFDNVSFALGKKIRLYGMKFVVIGVLEKQGSPLFGNSKDTSIFIPSNVIRRIYGENNRAVLPFIVIKPEKGIDNDEFIAQLKQRLRIKRGIKADDIDNFFVNQLQGFADVIDDIIGTLNLVGLFISFFSLLVGGFGIANIMFVSVKERTNLIGIQKSLGAKNKFILFQFLFEAVILALIGGVIGLVLVYFVSLIVS